MPIEYRPNIIIVLFMIIFILYVLVKIILDFFETKKRKNNKFVFDILFELHIKYKFPEQPRDTIACLKNGIRTMLGPHTKRPCVLLLLAAEESTPTAMLIATKLIQVTLASMSRHRSESFIKGELFIDGSSYAGVSDFWDFYNAMRKKIKAHKTVVVYNFQMVHPHAVTVLPSLTHEVFCPQSQALIILVMGLDCYNTPSKKDTSCTRLVTTSLEQTFGLVLDQGQMDDLLRTVTARAAVVVPGKKTKQALA